MKKIVSVIGVMVALVLSLTGCVKMNVDLAVSSPEKATLNMTVAVDKAALGGRSFKDALTQIGASEEAIFQGAPEGVTHAPYDKDGFQGFTITATDKSLTEIGDIAGKFGPKLAIEYRDGLYYFTGQGLGGNDTATLTEANMTVTFPGKVTAASAGGTIEGNTVTFDMRTATGNMTAIAKEADHSAIYLSLLFGGLALVGAVVAVGMMRKPEKAVAHADHA
ncbi:LppM family (lipo)protein [Paeniglutamicibacter sp. NPDC012692]|uniref:LppM family (lipo)protein n=1 Tax=Paeniglutamicibacter sp. NPDC012692 TaxID=3364388 RepID=UPI0036907DA4